MKKNIGLLWAARGPRPTTGLQVEGIVDGEVVGAIKAVATQATRVPAAPGPPPVPAGDSAPASDLELGTTLPGVPQPQFLSADGRHVLSSRRIADDPEWDKYAWTIFDRDSGRQVGEIPQLRYAPFFMPGDRGIYQTPPYERLQGTDVVQESLRLRAVDLTTGTQVWSQSVRDMGDREPPPP